MPGFHGGHMWYASSSTVSDLHGTACCDEHHTNGRQAALTSLSSPNGHKTMATSKHKPMQDINKIYFGQQLGSVDGETASVPAMKASFFALRKR